MDSIVVVILFLWEYFIIVSWKHIHAEPPTATWGKKMNQNEWGLLSLPAGYNPDIYVTLTFKCWSIQDDQTYLVSHR